MKTSKQALKADRIERYLKQVSRPAQKHQDPNDRQYDRDVERKMRRMSPIEVDALLRAED